MNVCFVFLMQFGLRRATSVVSSPIHLFTARRYFQPRYMLQRCLLFHQARACTCIRNVYNTSLQALNCSHAQIYFIAGVISTNVNQWLLNSAYVGLNSLCRPKLLAVSKTIFNMAAVRHLEFQGSGFFQKPNVEMHRNEYVHARITLGSFLVIFGTLQSLRLVQQ